MGVASPQASDQASITSAMRTRVRMGSGGAMPHMAGTTPSITASITPLLATVRLVRTTLIVASILQVILHMQAVNMGTVARITAANSIATESIVTVNSITTAPSIATAITAWPPSCARVAAAPTPRFTHLALHPPPPPAPPISTRSQGTSSHASRHQGTAPCVRPIQSDSHPAATSEWLRMSTRMGRRAAGTR